MGWMDKAKKLAEQAQEKLDEVQKNMNSSSSSEGQANSGVRYDEHGRPIQQDETPAAATPPPSATPAESAGPPPPPAADSDANSNPDPFKPIQ
jgi:hypothetical protein